MRPDEARRRQMNLDGSTDRPGTASKGPFVARDLQMTRFNKECIKKMSFSETPEILRNLKALEKVPFSIEFLIKSGHFEASGDQGPFGGQDWSHFRSLKSHRAVQVIDI